jgi:hypothetical protein
VLHAQSGGCGSAILERAMVEGGSLAFKMHEMQPGVLRWWRSGCRAASWGDLGVYDAARLRVAGAGSAEGPTQWPGVETTSSIKRQLADAPCGGRPVRP